jgi:hypothetical protein
MSDQNIITWNVPNILSVWLMAAVGASILAFTLSMLRKTRGTTGDKK